MYLKSEQKAQARQPVTQSTKHLAVVWEMVCASIYSKFSDLCACEWDLVVCPVTPCERLLLYRGICLMTNLSMQVGELPISSFHFLSAFHDCPSVGLHDEINSIIAIVGLCSLSEQLLLSFLTWRRMNRITGTKPAIRQQNR